jgi:DnaJ-class molecular chaperone
MEYISCIHCGGSGQQPEDLREFDSPVCYLCEGRGKISQAAFEATIRAVEGESRTFDFDNPPFGSPELAG